MNYGNNILSRKIETNITESKSKCLVCGHPNLMTPTTEKMCCTWCNNSVRNTLMTHFRYVMLKMLREA